MPRTNSQNWSNSDPISATRLQNINQDLDDIYANWTDRLKVWVVSWLQIEIWKWVYKVWTNEWQYSGWTATMTNNATNYIMIDGTWTIQQSTVNWNSDYAKLAIVIASGWNITSVENWKNDVIGWPWSEVDKTVFTFVAGENISAWQAVYLSNWSWSRTAWRIYLAGADNSTYLDCSDFIWFATATATSWNSIKVSTSWVDTNQTWLTAWLDYFLSDTFWGISATNPWKNKIKVWKAMTTTSIKIFDSNIMMTNNQYIYTVWQDVAKWDCLSLHAHPTYAAATNVSFIWNVAAQTKVAFNIFWSGVSMSSIILKMWKQTTPTDNCILRIETDNWSNAPSWTLAHANATVTVAASWFSTSSADYTFTFPWSFTLTKNQKYWLVFSRSWALDNTNRFGCYIWNQANSVILHGSFYNWSVWTADTVYPIYFQTVGAVQQIAWKSNSVGKDRFIWFAENSASIGWNVIATHTWIFNKFTWLTPWIPYFMQSATSWTIWTGAWSWTAFRLWIAVSPTELFVWPQLSSYSL